MIRQDARFIIPVGNRLNETDFAIMEMLLVAIFQRMCGAERLEQDKEKGPDKSKAQAFRGSSMSRLATQHDADNITEASGWKDAN